MHRALNLEHKRPTGEPFSLSEEKFANGDPGGWEPTESNLSKMSTSERSLLLFI